MNLDIGKYIYIKNSEMVQNHPCYLIEPINAIVQQIHDTKANKIIVAGPGGSGRKLVLEQLNQTMNAVSLELDPYRLNADRDQKYYEAEVEIQMAKALLFYARKTNRQYYEQYFQEDSNYLWKMESELDMQLKSEFLNNVKKLSKGQYTALLLSKVKNIIELESMNLILRDIDYMTEEIQKQYIKYEDFFQKIIMTSGDRDVYEPTYYNRKLEQENYKIVTLEYGKQLEIVKQILALRAQYCEKNIPELRNAHLMDELEQELFNIIKVTNGNIKVMINLMYRMYMYLSGKPKANQNDINNALFQTLQDVIELNLRYEKREPVRTLYL